MTTAEEISTIAMNGFGHRAVNMAAQSGVRIGVLKYEFPDGSWIEFCNDGSINLG